MPITVIPPPNVPDPMQQLGQLYEMYSAMQLEPLKRQLAEGQIAAQQQQMLESQQQIETSKQAQATSRQSERESAYRLESAQETDAKKKVGLQKLSDTFISTYGSKMTPEELANIPALIESEIPMDQIIAVGGGKLQGQYFMNDPRTAASISASRASAAASAEQRAAIREERGYKAEDRQREAAGRAALGDAVKRQLSAAKFDPDAAASLTNAVLSGVPISSLPKSAQVSLDPELQAQLKAARLGVQIQREALGAAREKRRKEATGDDALAKVVTTQLGVAGYDREMTAWIGDAIRSGVGVEHIPGNAKLLLEPVTRQQLEAARLQTEAASEQLANATGERKRGDAGRDAMAGLVRMALDNKNYDPRASALAEAAVKNGIPVDSLDEATRAAINPSVMVALKSQENEAKANQLRIREAEASVTQAELELKNFQTGQMSPQELAKNMPGWMEPIMRLQADAVEVMGKVEARKAELRADPVLADDKQMLALAEKAVDDAAKKQLAGLKSIGVGYANRLDQVLKPLGVQLSGMVDPNAASKPVVKDPGISAAPSASPVPEVPGLDPEAIAAIRSDDLNGVLRKLDQLVPRDRRASYQARAEAWKIFKAYGIPTDPAKVDEWIKDRFRSNPNRRTFGGKEIVLWPAAQIARIKELQKVITPVAGSSMVFSGVP